MMYDMDNKINGYQIIRSQPKQFEIRYTFEISTKHWAGNEYNVLSVGLILPFAVLLSVDKHRKLNQFSIWGAL